MVAGSDRKSNHWFLAIFFFSSIYVHLGVKNPHIALSLQFNLLSV